MRSILVPTTLLFLAIAAASQTSSPAKRADLVRDTVGTIAGADKNTVDVVLNDLREFRGKITAVYDDVFILEPKKPKSFKKITIISIGSVPNNQPRYRIKYGDVLQIAGKKTSISFVPDPASSPYSTWGDGIGSIVRGEFVQVHRTAGGGTIHGVYYRSTADSLSLMRGNDEIVIPADEITKVYRVKGDTRGLLSKLLTGGERGRRISEDWLPIGDPRSGGHPVAIGIGAAIGATLYLLSFGETERVLVYSR